MRKCSEERINMARPHAVEPRENVTSLRLTLAERQEMEAASASLGFKSLSHYIRHLHKMAASASERGQPVAKKGYGSLSQAYASDLGTIYQGDSLEYLHNKAK